MYFNKKNVFLALIIILMIGFGVTAYVFSNGSSSRSVGNIQNETITKNTNPIDEWYLEIDKQYGGSHSDGWISYIYGEAWKAELHHLVEEYNTESANNYYNSVLKEANALYELLVEQEENNGWGTGSSGRIELACANVYRNALYQLYEYYSDFIFDADAATQEYLGGT